MRTDRLTDEQKRYPFLGMPFWIGRGFGLNLSVVTDPAKSRQLFGPGGVGHVRLAGRLRHLVAGRPVGEPDPHLSHPESSGPGRRRRAAVAGNTSLAKLQTAQPKFVRRTYQALDI